MNNNYQYFFAFVILLYFEEKRQSFWLKIKKDEMITEKQTKNGSLQFF